MLGTLAKVVPLAALISAVGCRPGPEVIRVADGRDVSGPWVSPEAYSAYLEGTLAEARGDTRGAAQAYSRLLEEDPRAAAAWARLGAVLCRSNPRAADKALDRAAAIDPDSAGGFLARAECELARGRPKTARRAAERAVANAPESTEAGLLLVRTLEQAGAPERARRWLVALVLYHRSATEPARQLAAFGARTHDGAAEELARLGASATPGPSADGTTESPDACLQRAFATGDERAASDLATGLHMPRAEFALAAVENGRVEVASRTARRVLAAEPDNGSALVAALASADLASDDEALRLWVSRLPEGRYRPSPRAARVFEALLERRLGKEAARTWADAYSGLAARNDGEKSP